MKAFKLFSGIVSVLCTLSFLVILKLWITNDPLLLHGVNGFLLWGISIVVGGAITLLSKRRNSFHLLAKAALITTILSAGLLILTGVIYVTTSSMP